MFAYLTIDWLMATTVVALAAALGALVGAWAGYSIADFGRGRGYSSTDWRDTDTLPGVKP
jgi:membrane protein YqaA with SNARE-associated domain